jgi:hypothetical protein
MNPPIFDTPPAGTTLWRSDQVSSLRGFGEYMPFVFRRLKSTVNKVLSLRVGCKKCLILCFYFRSNYVPLQRI